MKPIAHYLDRFGAKFLTGELNRWQKTLRYAISLARYGRQELNKDRAGEMAAALTYRTIFSLVPVIVLGLVLFNAFGGFKGVGDDMQQRVYDYLGLSIAIDTPEEPQEVFFNETQDDEPAVVESADQTDDQGVKRPRVEAGGEFPASTQPAEQQEDLKKSIDKVIKSLSDRIAQVSFTSIGLVGFGVLIWAALKLVVSVEHSFNRVYHAPQGRPWHLRISIYWATVTLGPLLLLASFYFTNQLLESAGRVAVLGWLINLVTPFFSLAFTWIMLLLLYLLMPNTRVKLRPALIGAISAAILWESSKWGFRLYVKQAVGYSALYGSLGLVPLFLLWLYLTWLITLFGLEIAFVLQTMKVDGTFGSSEPETSDHLFDAGWVLPVATVIGSGFNEGKPTPSSTVADRLGLPGTVVDRICEALRDQGVIHQVDGGENDVDGYTLSFPPQRINLGSLVEIGQSLTMTTAQRVPGSEVLKAFDQARLDSARGRTLDELIEQDERKGASEGE